MPNSPRGETPVGYGTKLLHLLRNYSQRTGLPSQRLQQQIAFERFLARVADIENLTLKGGFALQLRYGFEARATRDLDLRTGSDLTKALRQLEVAIARPSVSDHFTFELRSTVKELQGAPGGTARVRLDAFIAGRQFTTFTVDVSSGDALIDPPVLLEGSNLLGIVGLEPVAFRAYPIEQHLAEKLHAYTLPRSQENTRVKDLFDILAIALKETVDDSVLRRSVEATFAVRATHSLPGRLAAPPESWTQSYAKLAAETEMGLPETLKDGYLAAGQFWDPFLAGPTTGHHWTPATQMWKPVNSKAAAIHNEAPP